MARRRKQSGFELIIELIASILITLTIIISRVILFVYDVITIFTSKYYIKSGNGFFKTYFNKGNYGEFILYRKIVGIFGKDYVFTNVYLDNKNTDHTEVDVIALSNHGIYVFEMKNYSGYIYGSEKDQYWTQVLNKYSKHKFYNPLRQNYAHIKAIEKYLELNENEIIPVVVFSNNSKLSKINVKKENHIIQIKDLNRLINSNAKSDFIDIPVIRRKEISVKLIERSNMPQEIKNNTFRINKNHYCLYLL